MLTFGILKLLWVFKGFQKAFWFPVTSEPLAKNMISERTSACRATKRLELQTSSVSKSNWSHRSQRQWPVDEMGLRGGEGGEGDGTRGGKKCRARHACVPQAISHFCWSLLKLSARIKVKPTIVNKVWIYFRIYQYKDGAFVQKCKMRWNLA